MTGGQRLREAVMGRHRVIEREREREATERHRDVHSRERKTVIERPRGERGQTVIERPRERGQTVIERPRERGQTVIERPRERGQTVIERPKGERGQTVIERPREREQTATERPRERGRTVIERPGEREHAGRRCGSSHRGDTPEKPRLPSPKRAVRRQKELEQAVQWAQENDKTLRLILEALANTDRHLTSYLADHIDAQQIPQEAQKIQTELTGHEGTLEDMKKKNLEKDPSDRVMTQIDLTQKKLGEVWTKFRLFQKPANFDQRLADCERALAGVKGQLGVLDIRSVEQDVVQSQLEQCMKLYKALSEVKGEVETVIKTGRQVVQRQQTEQPKELDDRLTALKLLYNQLGAQVTESKSELEKSLKLSRKLRKELNALTEWLAATDAELTRRSSVDGMPSDLEAEVDWAQWVHGETEQRQPQLQAVVELAEALKVVLRGNGGLVDDKVSLLHCNWIAVTSRAEEWLNLLLDYQGQMKKLDGDIEEVNTWIDGAEKKMDEIDSQGPDDATLKVLRGELELMRGKVEAVQALAQDLMSTRGENCQAQVGPKLEQLNQRFDTVAQRIASGLTAASARELEQYHSEAQIWLELLEEEVKQGENLKEEDFQEDKDVEEGAVKELLIKGENLQKRVPDHDKREQIRLKHNQLNSKYNTVKDLRGVRNRKALAIAPQWYQYRRKSHDLLAWLDDIERSVAELPDPPEEQRVKMITMTFR